MLLSIMPSHAAVNMKIFFSKDDGSESVLHFCSCMMGFLIIFPALVLAGPSVFLWPVGSFIKIIACAFAPHKMETINGETPCKHEV